MEQVRTVTARFPNVEVDCSKELVAEYAKRIGATVVVRGLRALSDYEKECQMALINKKINPGLETFFLMANEKYTYHSSSAVKELALFGADLKDFAPREIIGQIEDKYKNNFNLLNSLKGTNINMANGIANLLTTLGFDARPAACAGA